MVFVAILMVIAIFAIVFFSYMFLKESPYVTAFWYFIAFCLFAFSLIVGKKDAETFMVLSIIVAISNLAVSYNNH